MLPFKKLDFASFHLFPCAFYFARRIGSICKHNEHSQMCHQLNLSLSHISSDTRDLDSSGNKRSLGHFIYFFRFLGVYVFKNEDMAKQNLGKLKYILNMCIYQIHAVNTEKK